MRRPFPPNNGCVLRQIARSGDLQHSDTRAFNKRGMARAQDASMAQAGRGKGTLGAPLPRWRTHSVRSFAMCAAES
jgi:hypothetical protein